MTRTPLVRRTPLQPVTKDAGRRRRRFARQFGSRAFVAWLKRQGCQAQAAGGCGGPIDAAHLRPRGAGHGAIDTDGRPNLIGLCRVHHRTQHAGLWTLGGLKRATGIDLWAVARRQARAFSQRESV
jgi:hypothetical protein